MKIEITDTKDNILLERKDISFKIMHTGPTPSEKDVLAELAKALKIDSTHIAIDSIHQKYSALECDGFAKVYEKAIREKEEKKEEPKKEAAVQGEVPDAEKPAETAEEKKEEPVVEKTDTAEVPAAEEKPEEEKKEEKAPVEDKAEPVTEKKEDSTPAEEKPKEEKKKE